MTKGSDLPRKTRTPGASTGPSILALEKRIAFDGAGAAIAAKAAKAAAADLFKTTHDSGTKPGHHGAERHADHVRNHEHGRVASLFDTKFLGDLRHTAKRDRSVVFIETDVPDIKTLIKNIDPHTRIVLLDPTKDGVDEIANYLSAHKGMKNVYIFSHGGEAQLDLGTATLDSATMTGRYAGDLATIKASLAANANILVYGCDFAQNTDGDSAAHLLSDLTGASVAASTNATGGTAEGGDFILEDQVGRVTARNILSSRIALEYNGLLASQTTGAFTINTGTSGTATSSQTIATAYTADGAIKVVVTLTPNSTNSANSITTTTTNATFDTTAPAASYPTNASGAAALEQTLQFGGTTGNGKTDGTNSATVSIAYFDASTGAAITVTNPIIYIDRIGGSGTNASGASVSNSSDLTITSAGATLTKLGASSTAFNVSTTDVYETVNTTLVTSGFSTDANSDATKGTSAGAIQVNGSYSNVTFNWAKASGSVNGGDRIDLIFSADTGLTQSGSLPNKTYNDGQSGVSIATSQAFSNPSGLSTTYTATGLPAGLSINSATGQITGTVDHDASKNGATTSGSGATLDGTYNIVVTAKNSAGNSATQSFTIDSKNQAPTVGTKTSDQSNNDGDTITNVNAAAAFSDPNGDPLTYAASGLPAGLTISSAGVISGTVAKNAMPGTYSVVVTGTDDKGAATTETFSWVIKDVPPTKNGTLPNQTYTDGQAGISIATSQGFNNPNGNPLTYSSSGLPAGLSINSATGQITGTIDHDASKNAPTSSGSGATLDGTYTITVTANDGLGGTSTQTFTIDSKNTAPTLGTKTADQSNNDGDTVTAVNAANAFSDTNGDPLTYAATGLPTGLTISSAGIISGTVSKTAAPGTYSVTVTATDDKGAATNETFNWVIKDIPPTVGADTFAVPHDTPAVINVLGNDTDALGRQLSVTKVNGTAITAGGAAVSVTGGKVALNSDGTLTFTPNAGYIGTPSFTYTVADTVGGTTDGTVTGTVTDAKPIVDLNGPQTTANTVSNSTALGSTNWTTTNGAQKNGGYYFNADNGTGSLSQANVAGLNLGSGAYGAAQVIFGFAWNNGTPDQGAATVTVSVGGVIYAKIVTGTPGSDPNIATVTYLNGASGNGSSVTMTPYMNWTPVDLTIDLPANVAAKGAITFNVDASSSTDDVYFSNVRTSTLPATSYNYAAGYTEKGAPVAIAASTASVFDGDSANLASASVVLTNKLAGDQLSIGGTNVTNGSTGTINGLTYTVSDASGAETIALTGSATKAVYQQTLGQIAFANNNYAPSTTSRVFNVTANDGISSSNTAVSTISVADLNPSANGSLPNKAYTDGQAGISITTSNGFNDPSGAPQTYTVSGLPAGLSIDATTGKITGTIDHDASKNAPTMTGSGATLDGTYTVKVTATDSAGRAVTQTFTIDSTNQAPTVGTKTADQTTNDGATVSLDTSTAFSDPNTGDTLTFTGTNLPPGLAISTAGLITGTVPKNAQPGTYSVTVTATDDKGAATSETFNWVIKDVPPTANGTLPNKVYTDGQSGITIATSQGFNNPNGNTLAYSAMGLPAGLTINTTTGQITGTIDHDASKNAPSQTGSGATLDGKYTVTVTTNDGLGGTATQTFTIDSTNQAPTIGTKTADQTTNDGDTVSVDASKAFTDPNTGDTLTYSATNLPPGLAISTAGLITGTVPKNAQPGTYSVTITATDEKGAATSETFNWVIKDVPPTTNGTLANQTYTDGQSGISIATSQGFTNPNGNTLTYTSAGLPAGLTIDKTTGKITGTIDHDASKNAPSQTGSGATLDGTYTVTVTADDGLGGKATQTFTIDSKNTAPALGTKTADQSNNDGDTVTPVNTATSFSDANGDPLTYSATNLPAGLTISAAGVISGKIANNAQPGTYAVVVTATDDKGAATTEMFNWVVKDVPPTANGTLANQTYTDGQAGISITTSQGFNNPNGNPLTYSASGLPKGLTIDPTTGKITGTVDHDASTNAPSKTGSGATLDGKYTVTVTANDGLGGTSTQTFTIDSTNQAPVVGTATAAQTNNDGQTITPVDASKAFSDPNGDPLTYTVSNLPAGLSINAATGVISGTVAPNATPGVYVVRVLATDDKGAATRETFNWTINDVPPTPNGTLANQTYPDSTANIMISTSQGFNNPNGLALTYSATGLPLGLSIDQSTGQITGQLDHDASKNAPKTTGSGATLDGTYTIVVTANDGQGGKTTQTFTIDATNNAPTVTAQTPDQTGANGQTVSLDGAKAFADKNTGDTLTYAASGLPAGLSINQTTGLITGTIDKSASKMGPYNVTVTATDDKGAATTEAFKWTVNNVAPVATPPLPDTSAYDGNNVTITTSNGFTNPNNLTYTYSATGLPSGLTLDVNTGVISGTLNHDASIQSNGGGVYTIAVTANDGQGGTATNTFHLTSTNQAPVVGTKTANQSNLDGDAIMVVDASKAFSDPNGDPLTYSAANLPAGLTIDPTTGKISGTVAGNAKPGVYSVTVTATDDKGLATPETFTWTITDKPPVQNGTIANQAYADSTPGISIDASTAFTSPNGLKLSYSVSGLPAGLSIDATTGKITGTLDHDASTNAPSTTGSGATLDGKYTVTVTADDGQGGTATQTFTIDATNNAPVIQTNTTNQTNHEGDAVTVNASTAFNDPNKGDTLTYTSANLPAGLTIDAATGVISGTVSNGDANGSPYTVSVTATDDKGAATTETFMWVVNPMAPAASTPIPNQSYYDGSTVSVDAASHFTADPTTVYTVSGLPAGLSINQMTGQITGTLDHDASYNAPSKTGSGATLDGTYTVTVTATNSGGQTSQTFTFDAINQAPTVGTKTTDQMSNTGQMIATVDASTAFADPNGDPLTYSATGLPPGLTIDNTGKITGTISKTAPGTYSVVVSATDDKGAATSETFTWTVNDLAPTQTGTIANQTYADSTAGISIATSGAFTSPNNLPLTYSASGLPAGLAIDPNTGKITGQLDHDASNNAPAHTGSGATLDGKYTVVVTASDGQGGTATQTFTIDATNNAPAIVAQTADQHGADGQTVSLDTSSAFKDPNAGDKLTYSAANLPAGLTIDANTGLVTGTIDKRASANGPYTVSITATDDKGAATTETFQFAVDNVAPTATPPLPDRSLYDGSSVSYTTANGFTNPNGLPLTYSASGLPKGLSIDPTTGIISGTLDHDASVQIAGGKYTIAVTADDGQHGTATNTFHFTASNQAPVVGTKTVDQSNKNGEAVTPVDTSTAFSDPNPGDTLTYAASNLPAGLTIDPASGKITGTIAGNATPGSYYVTVTATDEKGAATPETFYWNVGNVPPVANGTLPNHTYADSTGNVSITTANGFSDPNNLPLTYSVTGLPRGLTIDSSTGVISGFIAHNSSLNAPSKTGSGATLDGTYTVVVTADDGQGGTATQMFKIDATNQAPIVGSRTVDQHNADGANVSVDASQAFSDPNTGDTITYAATGLPKGLTIDPNTGKITGTIDPMASKNGPYTVSVTATDNKGAPTTETFNWIVDDTPPTAGNAIPPATAADGSAIALIDASTHFNNPNGLPLTYSATGLPAGLSIDPTTGQITGTLDHDASKNAPMTSGAGATLDGTYTIIVTADDKQGGTATQAFTFDATNNAPVVGTKTADQHNADRGTVTLDTAPAFSDPNNGDVLTYKATGLPAGLAIDPNTGKITGTIDPMASKTSPYMVNVTATDDKGAATTETFNWVVDNVPPTAGSAIPAASAPDGSTIATIDTASHFSNPNGLSLTYTATGLPAGLSIDPASGKITGTVDHDASKNAPMVTGSNGLFDGTYTVIVTASDGQGGTATQSFTFDATNQAPVVGTKTTDQTSNDGQSVSVNAAAAFSDPNTGDVVKYTATGLPKGLTIDPNTGVISGTIDPAASTHMGPYNVAVTATDDKGAATTEMFNWVIKDVPPTADSAIPPATAADGSAITPVDTASHFGSPNGLPLTYTATGLPMGLSIDPMTGKITGTLDHDASKNAPMQTGAGATLDGTYTVTVTADDGQGGKTSQSFTIDATNNAPVVGTKTADQHGADSQAVTLDTAPAFSDPNTGDVLTYSATNLPTGLTINSATGRITGTIDPKASGRQPYTVTVTATDDKGAATSEMFQWAVDNVPPTVGTPVPATTAADGATIAPIDTASHFANPNGLPLMYSAAGLPPGLSIDAATGKITGTLDHDASNKAPTTSGSGATLDGTYTITVMVDDGQGGTATQSFTFDAKNSAPVVANQTPDQQNKNGATVSIDTSKAFTDPNTGDTVTYAATGLPKGLTFNTATGVISGTIDPQASLNGPYKVTVTATDDKGAATTETFNWVVDDEPPTAAAPIQGISAADGSTIAPIDAASHFNDPSGQPLTYSATGLPAGLSIDPATGKISGTLDHDASKNAPTTSGSGATLDGTYTIVVTAQDPQGGKATQSFTIDATNEAPVVANKTPDQTGADGSSVTLDTASAFSDPNTGDTLTYAATGLPKGLSIDPATGRITGQIDPAASKAGPYTVMVTATDDKGAAMTETFAWTISHPNPTATDPITPVVANDGTTIAPIDAASHFSDPIGQPLTYSATGLPAGLSIDPATGKITGTLDHDASKNAPTTSGSGATLDGTYTIVVTAQDPQGGTATQTFTIDARNEAPVVANQTPDQTGVDGSRVSLDASAAFGETNTGDVLTYAATGLPKGLSIDPATGQITGRIDPFASAAGPYTVMVTATDDKGAATTETFTWTISHPVPTATDPIAPVVAGDGTTIAPIDASSHFDNPLGVPLTYSATGLPAGLSIDPATGRITGTLDPHAARMAPQVSGQGGTLDGTYTIVVTADDGHGGVAQQKFTIDAVNYPPQVVSRTPDQAGSSGNPSSVVEAGRAFSDPNGGDTLTYSATGLPPGLTIDPNTGRISGTPTQNASRTQPYQVTVTATDSEGATASETFAWTIETVSPNILQGPRNLPPIYYDVAEAPRLVIKDAVLDAINLTTGDQEQSIAIGVDDIVLSTVNNVQPLDRQQPLDTPGAGIVRAGATTNERGDRFGRTQSTLGNELGGFSTSTYVGSSLRDTSFLTGQGTTTLNVETIVRNGVLTMSFDNASRIACVVPVVRYEVTLADDEPLPSWLHTDAKGVVTGKVPPGVEAIDIKVKATLTNGIVIERVLSIRADNGSIEFATPVSQKHAGLSLSDMIADARDTKVVRTGLAHLL